MASSSQSAIKQEPGERAQGLRLALAALSLTCVGLASVPKLVFVAESACVVAAALWGNLLGPRVGGLIGLGVSSAYLLGGALRGPLPKSAPLVVLTTIVAGAAFGAIRDISRRTRARRARTHAARMELKVARLEHDALLQAIPDAIARIDRAGTILSGDARGDASPYPSVEWSIGKNVADILPPEVAKGALESIQSVLTNDELATFEYRIGTRTPREFEARLVRGGAHEVLGIIRDISDIKKLERRLSEAHGDALKAAGTKGRFLATMSHQIRTPMNGVIGMTNVLLQTRLTPEQREYTTIIRNSGEALLSILDDVLDYARVEDGQIVLQPAPFALRSLLEELVELLAARAHDKGLEIASVIDARVPAWVQGDRGRLRQVIINLLGNAIKFTHQGHVALRAAVVGHERDTALIRFDVSDTGVGIPLEHQKNLFQDYGQAHRAIAREYGGTGLGLAISREIVELMGGRMLVESEVGHGSTFSFTARFTTIQDRTTGSLLLPRALSGAQLLSLPLHPLTQELIKHQLSPFGASIIIAEDLPEFARLRRERGSFDVALVELPLRGTSEEARALVHEVHKLCGVTPIAAMCSLGQRAVIDEVRRAGAAIVLTRPLRRSSLYDGLVELLGLTARAAGRRKVAGDIEYGERELLARVLVVEDNLVNQKVAVRTLEMLGCHAEVVENGAQAIDVLRERDFDVVLMDCQMPVLDGFEATRQLRSLEGELGKRTPVIALTANAMQGDRERCLDAGMDDYVAKPITVAALDEALRKWLPEQVPYRPRNGASSSEEKP